MTNTRSGLVIAGATLCVIAASGMAAAQTPSAAHNGFQPPFQAKTAPSQRESLPPALPGAQSTPDEAARAGEAIDLQPTDALFDAINRGDLLEARDALSRGADLQGRNVLGMTPLALSIDLSRKDITFLLLSYRNAGAAPPQGTAAPAAAASGKGGKAARQSVSADQAATPPATARPSVSLPRNYVGKGAPQSGRSPKTAAPGNALATAPSGQPGTPVPQAGFLGFGG